MVVAVLGMSRTAWRIWRGHEEMESGGSLGRQMFGRTKDRKPEETKPE